MNFITIPIQVIVVIFLVFAFSRVWLRTREGTLGTGMFLFWTVIWIFAILAIINPNLTTEFANKIGVGRGVDAAIYISLLLLFYLNFRNNVQLENLRHEITKLTREIALKNKK